MDEVNTQIRVQRDTRRAVELVELLASGQRDKGILDLCKEWGIIPSYMFFDGEESGRLLDYRGTVQLLAIYALGGTEVLPEPITQDDHGWGFPAHSRKAHYFVNGESLCRKYGFFHGELEDGQDDHSENCAECRKKKTRLPKVVDRA